MPDYEPEKAELASRDVVSRRMEEHIAAGQGASSRYGDHLWLDIRLLGRKHIDTKLREVREICQYFLGIDPVTELIAVRPAQHYSMGGIRTDYRGESQTLRGLFSAGEAACWDIHGFNRLGGNSVAETVVAGMLVGEYVADFCDNSDSEIDISTTLIRRFWDNQARALSQLCHSKGTENAFDLMRSMQQTMTDKVSIFRDAGQLQEAVSTLQDLLNRCRHIALGRQCRGANPELVAAYRVQKMLKLALCVSYGALQRTESRGAHFRQDYPRRNDRDWLKRTLASWPELDACLPELNYEDLEIKTMELPPGWRGYGTKDHIAHPETAQRQGEIDAIYERMVGYDRFALQQALMPYQEYLPPRLRGRNARLGETGL
jgi:fumarate reductase flavoprotein subunit